MSQTCPNSVKCPIFNGVLKGSGFSDTYKALYCENGETGRNKCKRFLIASKVGKCPEKVLPNSTKSVDEIIAKMKKEGVI